MLELLLSVVWLGLVAWLIWRAFRQRDAFQTLEPLPQHMIEKTGNVCVIVPARDEAANIAACLRSLLSQGGVAFTVVTVDDDSADATASIIAAIAEKDARVKLLHTPPLPEGWKGKVHACCTGLAAVSDDVDWLCFIDADVKALHPTAIASAVDVAARRRLDLLSLMPRQEMRSFAERLMMPCGLYILAFSQRTSNMPRGRSDVAATGQFMLFRRSAYEAVGGHASVRGEICEDVKLARRLKEHAKKVLLLDGSKVLSTRMYTGWDTLWPGIAKNLSEMLGGPARTVAVALIALAMAWAAVAVPAVDVAGCFAGRDLACTAAAPALLATAAALAFHIVGAIHFGIPAWYGFLFPFGYTAGAMIGFDSLRWRLTRRVRWKGRVYP